MKAPLLLAAAGLGFGWLALACDETGAPAGPVAVDQAPRSNFSNGPAESGAVMRLSLEEGFFFSGGDLEGTTLVFFAPENGLLDDLGNECVPTTAHTPLDFQLVSTGEVQRLLLQGREAYTLVFDAQPEWWNPDPPSCQDLLAHLIASGQSRFQVNDNDWLGTSHATNTVAVHAHGVLDDLLNGGKTRLQMSLHWQWMNDFTTLRFHRMRVVLSPDPRTS